MVGSLFKRFTQSADEVLLSGQVIEYLKNMSAKFKFKNVTFLFPKNFMKIFGRKCIFLINLH